MCLAAKSYYNAVHTENDFSLYNTPVLDFVQATREPVSASSVALLCKNELYAKGLLQALQSVSERVSLYCSPEAARKKLGKQKPDLWIVTEDMTTQPDQPWRADKTTPVILIARDAAQGTEIVKNSGKLTVLSMPASLDALRDAVRKYIL